jgi:predicted MPP superfamily phosphohydrolase
MAVLRAGGGEVSRTSEEAVTLAFVLLVVTVLCAYAIELVFALRRRFGPPRPPPTRARLWWRRIVLVLGTVGTACIVYGFTVEPTWVEVTRHRVALSRWPAGAPTVRIVHLSDLHVDATPGNEEDVPDLVAAENPDLVAFTGDSLNALAGRDRCLRCLARLAKIAPVYAVQGNWDVVQFDGVRVLEDAPVRLLDRSFAEVEVRGVRLVLAGLRFGRDDEVPAFLATLPRDRPVVFLHHTPDPILELADGGVDLVLAGHTHGGQVRLPGYGALLTLARHGKRFEAGLYREQDTWLYVTRGIGMEGSPAPRVRFLCRPEVTVIDLVPEGTR